MSTFFLVRHGLRVSRNEDTQLSEAGVQQAELTGKYLAQFNFQHLYVSPSQRTIETAKIINAALKIPMSKDARLKERMEFIPGSTTFENFLAEWDKATVNRKYQSPFGDSSEHAGNRVISLFDELSDEGNYLFVSHGGTIGDVVQNLFPHEPLSYKTDHIKNIRWVEILECSITEIQYSQTQRRLVRINDTGYLNV